MGIILPAVGTKGLETREDLEEYLAAFNRDDYAEYPKFYHDNFRVSPDLAMCETAY